MAVTLQWYDHNQTVLIMRYSGFWTLDDYRACQATGRAMLAEIDHPVTIIVQVAGPAAASPPKNAFRCWNASLRCAGDMLDAIIVVADTVAVRTFVELGWQLFEPDTARKLCPVATFDEALELAAQGRVPVLG